MKKLTFDLYTRYRKRLYSREDLEQTIWYLAVLAKAQYDPTRGSFANYLRYYAKQKIAAHMRGESLPKVADSPFSLHREPLVDTDRHQIPQQTDPRTKVMDVLDDPIVDLLREGYKPSEVCKKTKMTRKELREHLSRYRER